MARMCELTTPLGDALLFSRMRVSEGMSRPFEISLDAVSMRSDIDPGDLLGKKVSVKVMFDVGLERHFTGYVRRFVLGSQEGRFFTYRMHIVPWLWFMTRSADCRIFQKENVPAILQTMFREAAGSAVEERLSDRSVYEPAEYCVQYRETGFNFVSRLMEQEGIYYFFEHDASRDLLVLADSKAGHAPIGGTSTVRYLPPNPNQALPMDIVTRFELHQEVQSTRFAMRDYDFKVPGGRMEVRATPELDVKPQNLRHEVYDFPGDYDTFAEGENYASARIEELTTQASVYVGEGALRHFHVGRRFRLDDHPRDDHNTDYLIVTTDYEIVDPPYESDEEAAGFACRFTAIRAVQQYRPPRVTPRPLIHGIQSAVVVGPAGEEIFTDEYGRIKVQFHWDRQGKKDEQSSCFLRVAFLAAGARWGFVSIPRIGHEVIVSFLEGDPDRPLVTGVVYNGANMPPWDLPANKTQWGMLSRSSKGGSPANANALRFEDKKGSEQVWLHAEKNQDIEVENDETHWVGHDRAKTIDHDEVVHVKHDRTETVDHDETITIGNDRTEHVHRDQTDTIDRHRTIKVIGNHSENVVGAMSIVVGKTLTENVMASYTETVAGAMSLTVGAGMNVSITGGLSTSVSGDTTETTGGAKAESVSKNKVLSINKSSVEKITENVTRDVGKDLTDTIKGKASVEVAKEFQLQAKKVLINADDEIHLKVGSAEMIMKKNGDITIKGGKINVKGSGNVTIKGSQIGEN